MKLYLPLKVCPELPRELRHPDWESRMGRRRDIFSGGEKGWPKIEMRPVPTAFVGQWAGRFLVNVAFTLDSAG